MKKTELQRIIKIEDEIKRIIFEDFKLKSREVEFDIIPPQKMLEILAYRSPTNISNWKYGREWEKLKTRYENLPASGLPYELVINSETPRAYLMNNNTFAIQVLVIAHVYGHTAFFEMNKWFQNSRRNLPIILKEANERFNEYERRFGIDDVEKTIDACHSIQFNCDPFETETEEEKRKRAYDQMKKEMIIRKSEYSDLTGSKKIEVNEEIERYNQRLWRNLLRTSPVEETEDLMRYIMENSNNLEDWQLDIMDVLRTEGIYYWPNIRTKFINEGFACLIHEKIMNKLFDKGLLTTEEHAEYSYSNSLVKAHHETSLNPYLLGSKILGDIEDRWNKGKYGTKWEECASIKERENFDTHEMKGWEKVIEVIETHTDWMLMQSYLTTDIIKDINLYLLKAENSEYFIDIIIRDDPIETIKDTIINYFANSGIPRITVLNGNLFENRMLELDHKFFGLPLHQQNTIETLKHIKYLWGNSVKLYTEIKDKKISFSVKDKKVEITVIKH